MAKQLFASEERLCTITMRSCVISCAFISFYCMLLQKSREMR
jgi:hypothetical protein